eukprot:TRINITY_DN7157_c0_g1_i2.p1 TRINITY_DN7157_c0_g1~~TRINITY_DN7157_c0_g1_i2.p1  ORF type:complete len:388 (-),score=56.64 TRINITY_DN7157_c0_g1_i2:365-1528(-)
MSPCFLFGCHGRSRSKECTAATSPRAFQMTPEMQGGKSFEKDGADSPSLVSMPVSERLDFGAEVELTDFTMVEARTAARASWRLALNVVVAVNRMNRSCAQTSTQAGEWIRQLTRSKSELSAKFNGDKSKLSEPDEVERIRQLRSLIEPGQALGCMSDFAKSCCDDAFCRRLLRKYGGDIRKCTEKLKFAMAWREQHKDLLLIRKCVLSSDERVIGADLEKRPILYLCLKNQMLPGSQCLDHKTVCMLQAIDCMPEGVEQTVHIWDLHGQQFRISDLNPSPMIEIMRAHESYYAGRLHEVIIIGMPKLAKVLKDVVWPLVPESTKKKVKFMSVEESQVYLKERCDRAVCGRIFDAMADNRDDTISLEERKKKWMQMNKSGAMVSVLE